MHASPRVYDLIRREEGLRLNAYQCPSGKWTAGYGHTKGVLKGLEVTKEGAERWLAADVREAERYANAFLASAPPVTQGQYDAIVDFIFNIGAAKFGRSTFYKHIRLGEWKHAAMQIPRWVHDDKQNVLGGLVRRRAVEMSWFMEPLENEVANHSVA